MAVAASDTAMTSKRYTRLMFSHAAAIIIHRLFFPGGSFLNDQFADLRQAICDGVRLQ